MRWEDESTDKYALAQMKEGHKIHRGHDREFDEKAFSRS